jgi:hypothetical protein
MTPCEWHLLLDGAAEARRERDKSIARWLAPVVSAFAGQPVEAVQLAAAARAAGAYVELLAEDGAADTQDDASRIKAAERKLKALQHKIARRRAREMKCQA